MTFLRASTIVGLRFANPTYVWPYLESCGHRCGTPVANRGAPGMARPSPTGTYLRACLRQVSRTDAAPQQAG